MSIRGTTGVGFGRTLRSMSATLTLISLLTAVALVTEGFPGIVDVGDPLWTGSVAWLTCCAMVACGDEMSAAGEPWTGLWVATGMAAVVAWSQGYIPGLSCASCAAYLLSLPPQAMGWI